MQGRRLLGDTPLGQGTRSSEGHVCPSACTNTKYSPGDGEFQHQAHCQVTQTYRSDGTRRRMRLRREYSSGFADTSSANSGRFIALPNSA